jgi:replicative DNA helicase
MVRGASRETRHSVLSGLLKDLDSSLQAGELADLAPVATGFGALDQRIGGGLGPGDLMLVAGAPGVGKTIATLQWARNMALAGIRVVYVCYEHDEFSLMTRLLAMEVGEVAPDHSARDLQQRLRDAGANRQTLEEAIGDDPTYALALAALRGYADNLVLVRASGAHTAIDHVDGLLTDYAGDQSIPTILFVDYIQKIAMHPEPDTEGEKVTRLIESLKDLALDHHVPIVSISAVGFEGMDAARIRLHHLRGSSALAFEADVIVLLNDKLKAISRVHLAYDAHAERKFKDQVVFTIEKNRGGPNLVDLEFNKDFRHFRFHPNGGVVNERLVSERLDEAAV